MSLTQLMSQAGLWVYPVIALVLFLGVFVGVVVRTFSRRSRRESEQAAQLPLEDDTPILASSRDCASSGTVARKPSRAC
jgi:cbb3-type cytochrome oxidase subunit 3